MNTTICDNNNLGLEINQDQVNKFYQERQRSKKNFTPSITTFRHQNTKNESLNHDSFKNLYRRKSLKHKMKEDESMFTSFNNSVDYDKPLVQSLLSKSTNRKVYENYSNEEQVLKTSENHQNGQALVNQPRNHNSLEQHRKALHGCGSSESLVNRIKKRSNSVQLESPSMQLSLMRQQKGTVPLSTILKKYQEEVIKMQKENMKSEVNIMPFSKMQLGKAESSSKSDWNKEDYETFNPSAHVKEQSAEVEVDNLENRLPQVVDKCIDKWRDLEMEQLKAERLYNSRKDAQKKQVARCATLQAQPIQNESITKQYEKCLQEKDQRIKELQRQNTQYKKFVQSIIKMKSTLEDSDSSKNMNPKSQKPQKQNNISSNEPETNLKELWRWIKSLPAKKSHENNKSYLR